MRPGTRHLTRTPEDLTREWRGEVLTPRPERGGPDRGRAGIFQMGRHGPACYIARPLRTLHFPQSPSSRTAFTCPATHEAGRARPSPARPLSRPALAPPSPARPPSCSALALPSVIKHRLCFAPLQVQPEGWNVAAWSDPHLLKPKLHPAPGLTLACSTAQLSSGSRLCFPLFQLRPGRNQYHQRGG